MTRHPCGPSNVATDTEPKPAETDVESIRRLRDVPLRMLVPSLITLGAICAGLTAIRLAIEARFEFAVLAIVFAAILDALDGRAARMLKASTSFGEQLDSLADFVNFGVAPAIIVYLWTLKDAPSLGWIVALVFAICGCLRLARFNVMLEDPDRKDWEVDFFTGVPAPAGALLALLPVYLGLLGAERFGISALAAGIYVLCIGGLMASSWPSWSGKRTGQRISARNVPLTLIGFVLLVAFLFSYPWAFLSIASLVYLATLPFSARDHKRRMNHSAASG